MTRRTVISMAAGAIGLTAAMRFISSNGGVMADAPAASFEIARTDEEWRRVLAPARYHVLREHGTERAFSSALNDEHRNGTFLCGGCRLPLFSSKTKFDSGTGWPSFWAPLDDAIATSVDASLVSVRTEVHCRRCGGHLGHVFTDGPRPTGLRYCMNGVAMTFEAAE